MRLFHQYLAVVEQRSLGAMVGKFSRLAAHLGLLFLLFLRLQPCRHGDESLRRARLERAAAGQ